MLARRDGGSGHPPERHRPSSGTHVVELRFMHVPAKDVTRVSGPDAFFRLRRTGDVGPLLRRGGARMHEENIVFPDGERQAAEKCALPLAKLRLSPGNGGLRVVIQGIVGTT